MDDRTLALLGDKAAQERITERGELLPCPWCNRTPEVEYDVLEPFEWAVICPLCGVYPGCCDTEMQARLAWNTRATILTETQIALLKIAQEPRKFEEGTK